MSYIHLKENLNPPLREDKILGLVFIFLFFKKRNHQLDYWMLSVLVLEVLYIAELF